MGNNLKEIVWPGFQKICPPARLGGIYAKKPGYHNERRFLKPTDYSVIRPEDKRGPDDEPCAIDLTFPDAQRGDYSTIKVYSKRLYVAGQTQDPRVDGWREFFGNTDNDTQVEGWDFAKNQPSTSDRSHLWHIHMSEHRENILKPTPAYAILSVLSGESLSAYLERTSRKVTMEPISGKLPVLEWHDTDATVPGGTTWVRRAQAELDYLAGPCVVDGRYEDKTAAAVKRLMKDDPARSSTNGRIIGIPEWRRLYGIW